MKTFDGLNFEDILVQSPFYSRALNATLAQPHQTNYGVSDNSRPHETGCGAEPPLQPRNNGKVSATQCSSGSLSYHLGDETAFVGGSSNNKFTSPTTVMLNESRDEGDHGSLGSYQSQVRPSAPTSETVVPCSSFDIREKPIPHLTSKRNSGIETEREESQKRTRVRPLRRADDQDEPVEEDNWDNDRRSVSRSREGQCDEEIKIFACPYLRRYPATYQCCLKFNLRRIRDVKQHLTRRHYQSPFYCPTCYEKFPSIKGLGDHIGSKSCTPRSPVAIGNSEGVSREAQDQLRARVNRTATAVDQWYSVWDILFVEVPRPSNPYLEDTFTETMRAVHMFWQEKAPEIIPMVLKSQSWSYESPDSIKSLLGMLFKEIETQFEQSLHPRSALTDSATSTPIVKSGPFQVTQESYSTSSSGFSDAYQASLEHNPIPRCATPQLIESDNAATQAAEILDQGWHPESNAQFEELELLNLASWLDEDSLQDDPLNNKFDWENVDFSSLPLLYGDEASILCGQEHV